MPDSTTAEATLAPWQGDFPDLLIVAGEHSGDEHAARLVREMRRREPSLRIAAIGGEGLRAAGAHLLHDLTQSSVVGLAEVLSHYRYFRDLFEGLVSWIREHRPRAVCLVDYPGFNLRLAARLRREGISRKGGGSVEVHYYISPQIWAWKAGRRFAMAETLDSLGVIFPFEVACYRDTALDVTFVGHPFVSPGYQLPVRMDPNGPVLLLPGSRRKAVGRIFPAMLGGWECYQDNPEVEKARVLTPGEGIAAVVRESLEQSPVGVATISLHDVGNDEPQPGSSVLSSSGTMSLCCALAGIPGAIVYRVHPVTYWCGRMLVQVPYLGIANLILPESPIYPEFLQSTATPQRLAAALHDAVSSTRRKQTKAAAEKLRDRLAAPGPGAASWLLNRLDE